MNTMDLVRAALKEDMPQGDITTDSLGLIPREGRARLLAKEDLILSGTGPFELTVLSLDPGARLNWQFAEGKLVLRGQIICTIQGDLLQLLKAERVALNFLGHLSGIATLTSCFVKKVSKMSCARHILSGPPDTAIYTGRVSLVNKSSKILLSERERIYSVHL